MQKWFYLVYLVLAFAKADGLETRLIPEAEPLALVHDCVNVVTGDFVLQQTDLCFGGLCHARNYDSGSSEVHSSLGKGFTWAIARAIGSQNKGANASLEEREGVALTYRQKKGSSPGLHYEIDPVIFRIRKNLPTSLESAKF